MSRGLGDVYKRQGVDEALRERGAKDGDIVRIGNFEFEFVD